MEDCQVLILFFKVPMGTRNNFLEMYRQYGHAASKSFASPAIQSSIFHANNDDGPELKPKII